MPLPRFRWFERLGLAKQALWYLLLAALTLFVLRAAWLAVGSAFTNDDFPEALAVKVELMPLLFPLHMVAGGLTLVLVPLTLLLRKRPPWHRPVGRVTATIVLVAGVTAFPVALVAPVTFWSAAGFSMQGAAWLVLLAKGLWHIRRREVIAHRACMLMLAAVTSGAIFFRVYLALWAIFAQGRGYELFYALDAWLAWLLPLLACAWFVKRSENRATPA